MRICFVTHRYPTRHSRGGAGIDTQLTAQYLSQSGHAVHVVCVDPGGVQSDESDGEVAVHFVPPQRVRIRRVLLYLARVPALHRLADVRAGWELVEASLGAWLAVMRLHHRRAFDLIHVVDLGGMAFVGLIWPCRNVPVLLRGHGMVDPGLPGMQWPGVQFQYSLERFCLRRADYVAANSKYLSRAYLSRLRLDAERVGVLYTPPNMPQAVQMLSDIRKAQGWQSDNPIVLYVGRVSYLKGSDLLFAAMQQARQQCLGLRLVLLGDVEPSFQAQYEQFMRQSLGWIWHPGSVSQDQVSQVMFQSTVCVLPSRKETFGRVLVEAQMHGLPVIGADIDGIPETMEDGRTGWLIKANDVGALAEAITGVCRERKMARQMGQYSCRAAESRFGFSRVMQQHLQVYEGIAQGDSLLDITSALPNLDMPKQDLETGLKPTVSVIIPTRDRPEVLRECLSRILGQDYEHFEVIVVDNSTDQARTLRVVQQFPSVIYVREDPNMVIPAHMRNSGIAQSRGEILAFVDDDSLVFPGWIRALVEAFALPDVGGVTGRVIEADAPLVNTPQIGRFHPNGALTANFNNLINDSVEIGYLHGCNHAARRTALEHCGVYDPWLVVYEDPEIGVRIRKSGYRLLYVPEMIVEHLKASKAVQVVRRSEYDPRSQFLSCRSLAYFSVSHFGLRKEFAKTAFVNLPKGVTRSFLSNPSYAGLLKILAVLAGGITGYFMAAARWLRIHRPPSLPAGGSQE